LQYALDNRIGDLNKAALLYKVEKGQQEPKTKATSTEQVVTKKRAAAVVDGGRSKAPDTTTPARPKKMTLSEAYEAAKAAHARS
jgi:hypothetical protein